MKDTKSTQTKYPLISTNYCPLIKHQQKLIKQLMNILLLYGNVLLEYYFLRRRMRASPPSPRRAVEDGSGT